MQISQYIQYMKLYKNFIQSLDSILISKDGFLFYDKNKIKYDFHSIRVNNIVEVLYNEIEYVIKNCDFQVEQ